MERGAAQGGERFLHSAEHEAGQEAVGKDDGEKEHDEHSAKQDGNRNQKKFQVFFILLPRFMKFVGGQIHARQANVLEDQRRNDDNENGCKNGDGNGDQEHQHIGIGQPFPYGKVIQSGFQIFGDTHAEEPPFCCLQYSIPH